MESISHGIQPLVERLLVVLMKLLSAALQNETSSRTSFPIRRVIPGLNAGERRCRALKAAERLVRLERLGEVPDARVVSYL